MKDKEYTRIDRLNLLKALEARLSAQPSLPPGPQVQLFRIGPRRAVAPPPLRMADVKPQTESSPPSPPDDPTTAATTITKPAEHLIQMYTERIHAIQGLLAHLAAAEKDRQRSADAADAARAELEAARRSIADLRGQLRDGDAELAAAAAQRDEAERKRRELLGAYQGLARRLEPFVREGVANEVVRIHRVLWGPDTVLDEEAYGRLLDAAARGEAFEASGELVGWASPGTREGEGGGEGARMRKTLVVAYSRPQSGPLRWLVVEEGCTARFEFP
ncbi:hypothetical protein F4779DRAFT_519517 [Xylariaceae sp. FL0662B]|nr:hypothetical protein F4779DRAFT_519517 [Xylariaceae sp. FL0662B]